MASLGIPIFTGSLDDFDEHPVSNVVATKPAVKNVLNNLFVFIILFPLFYLRNNSLFVVAFDNVFPNN